jgi:hypothetical protein
VEPPRLGGVLAVIVVLIFAALAARPASAGDYANWAAIVVAGDWRSHGGGETEAFENTRRDVAKALVVAGFSPDHVAQVSLRPPKAGDPSHDSVSARVAAETFLAMAAKAKDGCLFYLTSHGSPDGAVFGPDLLLTPSSLGALLDSACPGRPTVVVISACFSGIFASGVAAPERMVMTASRADRSSFGCGDKDKYPYFDACILKTLPEATDFPNLAVRARACVAKRETEENLDPPSEPQTVIGAAARMTLPLERFDGR